MKKSNLQIAALAIFGQFFYSFFLFAEPLDICNQSYGLEGKQSIYNAPSRIAVDGCWDAFVTASFLYWLPREKGLQIAATSHFVTGKTNVVDVGHSYKPGFEVGLGWNIGHDDWVIDLGYTRYHAEQKKTIEGDSILVDITPSLLKYDNGTTYDSASGKWKLMMDLLNLNLSRPFYSGKHLTLTPTASLCGGWIDQRLSASYEQTSGLVKFSSKQNSWIVGPQANINARWLLGSGLRFFGNLAAALFYQKFTIHPLKETDSENTSIQFLAIHNSKSSITPYMDMDLGIGYGTYFWKKKWHIDLALSYEFQIYWEQNHMRYLNNNLNASDSLRGYGSGNAANLLLHGLTCTARLDF